MADKEITTAMLLPSGEKAVLKKSSADTGYNIESLTADIHITYDGLSKGSAQIVLQGGGEGYINAVKIKTNVSDNHGEVFYIVKATSPDEQPINYFYMVSSSLANINKPLTLINDASNYHKLNLDVVERTKAFDKDNEFSDDYEINFSVYNSEATFAGGLSATTTCDGEVYVCASPTDFRGLHSLLRISTTEYYFYDEDNWEETYGGLATPQFDFSDDDINYFATQIDNPYHNDAPVWETLPVNPNLTFKGNSNVKFGDNFAVCVSAVEYEPWADVPFSYLVPACYYGNYGESRSIDVVKATTTVRYNGVEQEIPDGNVYDWAEQWAQSEHEPGKLTYVFTNNNFSMDGFDGTNVCEVTFTEGADDVEPPTVQRIMFRDSEGVVTNQFKNADGASVVIVGGDFIRNRESRETGAYPTTFTYYTFAEVECHAEYAPHGSSEFLPFELEADPEKFFMPGFGEYLSANLNQVSIESSTSWYDLRVSMKDKAGNTHVQTISPAFKIEKLSGISDINVSSDTFVVKNQSIAAEDGAEVDIYSITGAKVANSGLRPGVYVAKSADGRYAKVLVK